MRKKTRRKVWAAGAGPVAAALALEAWNDGSLDAEILALTGEGSRELVNAAGRRLYIILGAARLQKIETSEHPDWVAVQGAVDAVFDQTGDPDVQEQCRTRVLVGLHAVLRLQESIDPRNIVRASIELQLRLKTTSGVHMNDFNAMLGRCT